LALRIITLVFSYLSASNCEQPVRVPAVFYQLGFYGEDVMGWRRTQ
jgi:hypothetical protein